MSRKIPNPITVITALEREARPLVARWGMERVERTEPFRVWAGGGRTLVVSGIGRFAAASAAGFAHSVAGAVRRRAWLNVGVGGHPHLAVGEGVLAHRVTDRATGRSWYPSLVLRNRPPTAAVMTVDRPETSYPEPRVYDMEAAGFFAAASRFSPAELVHAYKVISDNRRSPAEEVSSRRVEELIAARLDTIVAIAEELEALAQELAALDAPPRDFERIAARWRFSVTEQRRLERVLRRLELLDPGSTPFDAGIERLSSGRDVLRHLEKRADSLPVKIG